MQFLLREKTLNLLIKIRNTKDFSSTELGKGIYITHSTVTSNLFLLEERGIIRTNKEGRKRTSELTKKGKKILKLLEIVEKNL